MSRFWGGFAVASALWAGVGAYLVLGQGFGPPEPPPIESVAEVDEEPAEEAEPEPRRGSRRRWRRRGRRTPTGNATVGDDLREGEMRNVEMEGSGGEQQLRGAQIEAGFDAGMGQIRRCLVLIEGDDPVRGRITFGLRVAPTGRVSAVQLSGPRAATTGDAGTCLQAAARALRFDSFDGPEMVVRYPLTLE